MYMFMGKGTVRELGNQIDKVLGDIKDIQAEIDRDSDKIDNELNSCSRELINAQTTLGEIQPLIESLVAQVGQNAPDHIKVLVGTIADGITGKVKNTLNNLAEVQKNVKDVDKLTDAIDGHTDKIAQKVKEIDSITDKVQK
ncbi:hypothetical protein AA984_10040 [Brevibacillus formosus]|uniref:Uncharacterized protein n=3 Tax=Brevibacillus TaxID=55080 RepID=A0A0H0SKC2_9BACL|nr:hypothetical protein BP422_21985 [Brevibacillus formosus]AWX58452.1 hypothetical protein AB432_026925 [Brevibacillus brevis]NRR22258.1 hypothetical protein [Brevibacillus sp. MS2.2]PSK19425.1 hypothetical protein C7R94_11735 [Brevibacillus sp. NRRL NRS-603]RAT98508.1 hypothetical protein ASG16_007370 [Brevibacillus sp. Leaf182]